jgi:Na+-transporting NADH:ubiquinone oxidoreductase subunit NqrB
MGKGPPSWAPDPNPRRWETLLAIFVYPTPWAAAALAAWAIHHAISSPFTNEWKWFYGAFFGGPALLMVFLLSKYRRLLPARQNTVKPPT